jgi:signal transduction histidine kinase
VGRQDCSAVFDRSDSLKESTPSESNQDEKRSMADAYFDILAHDVTDLISPIMVHAEFITLGEDLPREARVSAAKIVRQIRRTANFILSFRMLHEIASNPPTEPDEFDIHSLAELMQKTASGEYRFKNPSISVEASPGAPVMVAGAEYIERIVMGLVDNAIRNASRSGVDVRIGLSEVERDDGQAMWKCEVVDDGPGIPDGIKAQLVLPFDASKRLNRGAPSSLMFYSAILGHLGGCLRIEDRVPGDMGKGTRAVVEFPGAHRKEACDS